MLEQRQQVRTSSVHGVGADGTSSLVFSDGVVAFENIPLALAEGTERSPERHVGTWTDLISGTGTWDAPRSQGGAFFVIPCYLSDVGGQLFYDENARKGELLTYFYGTIFSFRMTFRESDPPQGSK